MSTDANMLQAAGQLAVTGQPFVLLTVIATKGSAPREPGARMIWRPGDDFIGTIGGGQFENLALATAERIFADRSCTTEQFVLGAEAEQCCGGVMDVFIEYIGPAQRLVIFGAGHVSQALTQLLITAPFEIIIADDRPGWNTAERFPTAQRLTDYEAAMRAMRIAPAATLACVMTCSHDTDFDLLRRLLSLDRPPAFVGLIGSRSKRVSLFTRLVASGIAQERVQTVHCPIGVGDTGKEPDLLAISIAAQLLIEAKKLAAL